VFCWLCAIVLILWGSVRRSKKKIFSRGVVTAIYFHKPSPHLFQFCVEWLTKNSYNVISASQLIEYLYGRESVAKGATWISLDDGWRAITVDIISTAKQLRVPVTLFIPTGPVQYGGLFWWISAQQYNNRLPPRYQSDIAALWQLPETARKHMLAPIEVYSRVRDRRQAVTVEELQAVSQLSVVTIGSHTIHHPLTINCDDAELYEELEGSKRTLELWAGKRVECFAYPCGRFDGRESAVLQQLGYRMAATTEASFVSPNTDPMLIPRFCIPDNASYPEAVCRMVGVWQPFIRKLKAVFHAG
jgi:peptidoglycan/xylan/chitin deacetylase (PgdA/CDA1 family)